MDIVWIQLEYVNNAQKQTAYNVMAITQPQLVNFANQTQLGTEMPVFTLKFQIVKLKMALNAKSAKMDSILIPTDAIAVISRAASDVVLSTTIENAHTASLDIHLLLDMTKAKCTMLVRRMGFKETSTLLRRRNLVLEWTSIKVNVSNVLKRDGSWWEIHVWSHVLKPIELNSTSVFLTALKRLTSKMEFVSLAHERTVLNAVQTTNVLLVKWVKIATLIAQLFMTIRMEDVWTNANQTHLCLLSKLQV